MVLGRLRLIPFCLAVVACLALAVQKGADGAEKTRKPVMKHLKFDPSLPQHGIFDAMEEEKISVRLVAKNEFEGHLLVENLSDAPLSIELPEAFVGVQVLAQFGGGGGGFGGGGGGMGGQQGGGGGQNQAAGGGAGGGQGGGGQGGQGGQGGGFFSIPVGTVAKVPVSMVCLEHGKKEPTQRLHYTIVRPEKYSSDPRVHELCKMVGSGKLDRASAQAAAWHVANNMTWEELANKVYNNLGTEDTPYFSRQQLMAAQSIVASANARVAEAKERGELAGTESSQPSSASTKLR